ncbi:MAG: ABC transporter permease [Gemmatimonadales bacterium]|nr:ABC transporter permease [Gemmatimonadales bacterium]
MGLLERLRASTVWPMMWKEFLQLRRDRLTLGILLGIPAVQLMLFGYAIQTEVRHLPTVVLDEARSGESRALIAALFNTGNFDHAGDVTDRAEIARRIGRGDARAAIVVPADYTRNLKRGRPALAQVIVDAADPLASSAAISAATMAGNARAMELVRRRGAPGLPIEVRVRPWYNPTLRSSVYIVPGIIGVLLTMTMVIITAMAVVRERERGTLEQLVVTPISRLGIMLGKLVPFLGIGLVQISVILLLGRVLFAIPIRGSLVVLYGVGLFFIAASLGVGLLVSTAVRTQGQAMQLGFFYMLPNILLSGFMFPREAMPAPAQWLGALLPLTYFLEVLRGVLLKGVGLEALWPQALALVAFSAVTLTVSVRRFHKTIE